MRRSFLKQALVVLASCALFLPIALDYGVAAQAATVTISDNSCASFQWQDNGGGNSTLTCVPASPGQVSCNTPTASNGSPTLQTPVTLTANCSGGTGTLSYAWSADGANSGGCPGINPQANPIKADLGIPTATSNVACKYNVTATDSAAPPSQDGASKTVNYTTSGGGGGAPISCNGFANTINIELGWTSAGVGLTSDQGGFHPNDAVVAHFKTSPAAASTGKGTAYAVEFTGSPTARDAALNTTPCDFTTGLPLKKCSGSTSAFIGEVGPTVALTQGTQVASCALDLLPNTDYYFNIRNHPGSCAAATCDMKVFLQKPAGT